MIYIQVVGYGSAIIVGIGEAVLTCSSGAGDSESEVQEECYHSGAAENHPMTRCMAAMGHLIHWVQDT